MATAKRSIKKANNGDTIKVAMPKVLSAVDKIKEQTRLRQNLTDFRKKVGSTPLTPQLRREKDSLTGLLKNFSTNQRVQATGLTPAQLAANDQKLKEKNARKPDVVDESCKLRGLPTSGEGCSGSARKNAKRLKDERNRKNGGTIAKAKNGMWMQKAAASIKKRGTKGVCTGAKFGGPTCKPGSKRYNLAKTFKSIAKKKK
jgi:hypothetical protein